MRKVTRGAARPAVTAVLLGGLVTALLATPVPAGAVRAAGAAHWQARAEAAFQKLPLLPTPPMGWNSWNKFHCNITEGLIRQTADAMVGSGMRAAGYEYVNIDDCWMAPERDENGYLQSDPQRFPGGIKALADYVHERGLKLGIYSSAGTKTCQGRPASLGYEDKDAQRFAEWGVDLLKYDNCNNQGVPAIERYTVMAEALAATGRPIVYSICEWGANRPGEWAAELGHYWRTTGDISDNWGSVVSILDQQVGLEKYSGPSAWNDPDMLEVGNGGMSTTEYRSHMSLWSLLNAPLIAGNDLRNMNATTLALLADPDVIAVNQDWAGVQGYKTADEGDLEVWAKPLSDGGAAVVLFNRGPSGGQVSTTAAELGLPPAPAYAMRDVWSDATTETTGDVRASIPSHGSRMFVIRQSRPAQYEPATFLDVRTDTTGYVDAGATFTASVDFTNDGVTPAQRVEVGLDVPDGWSARAQDPTRFDSVPRGRTVTASFTVTAPTDASNGAYPFTASASFRTVAGEQRQTPGYGGVTLAETPRGERWISDLHPLTAHVGWGRLGIDKSVDGKPIKIAGVTYAKGIATHAPAEVTYYLGANCSRFTAEVGINDETRGRGSVTFGVLGDGQKQLAATEVILGNQPAQHLDVDVSGVHVLTLTTGTGPDNNNHDHADWGGAKVYCAD
ncbi:NPCBM/NEW2 domain-containing protein [Micromonospora sp. NPDC047738]|uniref:NPCBM/NEW2 domain-containing protein n=1 Tax=Micromonospora sp. NPDC047738 TaxID=3155741 RepID=UPI0033C95D41